MKSLFEWQQSVKYVALLVAAGTIGAVAGADEEQDRVVKEAEWLSLRAPGKYWIGVQLTPPGDALKAHLDIEHGMLVERIIDDGPAEKAGLKRNDIVLRFDDVEIKSLDDLINAIVKRKDESATLEVLRRGKNVTLQILAEQRPEHPIAPNRLSEGRGLLAFENWIKDNPDWKHWKADLPAMPFRVLSLGPGILDEDDVDSWTDDIPANLSITISKKGKEPAKITVEQDNDEWQVSEEDLGELPEHVRGHVERMLGRHVWRSLKVGPGLRDIWVKELRKMTSDDGHPGQDETRSFRDRVIRVSPHLRRLVEEVHKEPKETKTEPLEELRKEIQAIRRELRELRKEDDAN